MLRFTDISLHFSKIKILIFGSYHPDYINTIEDLVQYLRKKGFKNTFLAKELIRDLKNNHLEEKQEHIYAEIERLKKEFDFNIFVLSPERNDSVVEELTSLVKSEYFKAKSSRTIVYLPYSYNYTMVKGLISTFKLNVFEYQNIHQMYLHCHIFIKRNLI